MVVVYWLIGRGILERQSQLGWGAQVIDRLSADLSRSFPGSAGFSVRNLKYMRAFAAAWDDEAIVQQLAAQLPWGHHQVLLDKVPAPWRTWYAEACGEGAWSRAVLVHQIETRLHERQSKASNNFPAVMTPERAALAAAVLKDPYVLDFVDLAEGAHERHLEAALVERIRSLLLELGTGFSFVGSQHRLQVGERDFFIDLLFYHTRLHCYVVIDLKLGEFDPLYVSQMGFYLVAVDEQVATERDNPSIGLILCRGRDGVVAEYALRVATSPMAVASYRVLPPDMDAALPAVEDIERLLRGVPGPGGGESAVGGPSEANAPGELSRMIVGPAGRSVPVPAGFVDILEAYANEEQLRGMLSGMDGLEDDLEAFARGHGVALPGTEP
jgi:predicted nuclease of restriction endonuclease-like (RecB) superfamily